MTPDDYANEQREWAIHIGAANAPHVTPRPMCALCPNFGECAWIPREERERQCSERRQR